MASGTYLTCWVHPNGKMDLTHFKKSMLATSKNNNKSQNNSQAQASPSSSGGATALISVNTA